MSVQVMLVSKMSSYPSTRPLKVKVSLQDDVDTLYQHVNAVTKIPPGEIIIKLSRDGYMLRMASGWTLDFYEVKENSLMYVEHTKDQAETVDSSTLTSNDNTRRLMEIGRLKAMLEDQGSQENPLQSSPSITARRQGEENQLKSLFSAIRKGEQEFNNFVQANKLTPELLNSTDQEGWSSIHYAINFANKTAFRVILDMSDHLNHTTPDGYTPLMLAASKKSIEMFKAILESKKIDINRVTKKGSIVHYLLDNDLKQFLPLLAGSSINPYLADSTGKQIINILTDEELKNKLVKNFEKNQNYAHLQKKPDSLKGTVFKANTMFFGNLKLRYLEMNTNERSLIRYESKKDAPHKPIEIIPMRDITLVREESNNKRFRQSGLYYFEIKYQSSNLLATKSQALTKRWVDGITEAVEYSIKYEQAIREGTLDEKASELLDKPSKEIDLDTLSQPGQLYADRPPVTPTSKSTPSVVETSAPFKAKLQHFELLRKLGSGSFGHVYKCRCKLNGKIYAMKVLQKEKVLIHKQLKYAQAEANILRKNNHPFVLSLYFSFQTPINLYMVIDCCSDENLAMLIMRQNKLSEEEARFYLAELILAIEYLHSMNVLYRDLKPENVLVALDGHLMLADFGLSKENMGRKELASTFLGSPLYLAPEMVNRQGFSQASDIFGIGLIFYEMIFGDLPYTARDERTLYEQIKNLTIDLPEQVSPEAEDLINKLLIKDPEKRLGTKSKDEIKNHPFFKGVDWAAVPRKVNKPPLFEPDLRRVDGRAPIRIPDVDYDESNKGLLRVQGWSFAKLTEVPVKEGGLLQEGSTN